MQSRLVQLFPELRRVFRGSEGVNEPLKRGDGGVDLKYAGSNGLRRVLFAVDEVAPGSERPAGLDILKAHSIARNPNFLEKIRRKKRSVGVWVVGSGEWEGHSEFGELERATGGCGVRTRRGLKREKVVDNNRIAI